MIRSQCEVLSNRRAGAYYSLTLVAPEIAERAKPGQFVEIGVPDGRNFLLRRPFSIHQASRRGGWAGTLEVVFDVGGPGTAWGRVGHPGVCRDPGDQRLAMRRRTLAARHHVGSAWHHTRRPEWQFASSSGWS